MPQTKHWPHNVELNGFADYVMFYRITRYYNYDKSDFMFVVVVVVVLSKA